MIFEPRALSQINCSAAPTLCMASSSCRFLLSRVFSILFCWFCVTGAAVVFMVCTSPSALCVPSLAFSNSCWRVMYSDRALRRLVTASCCNKEQRGYLMNSCWRVMYSDRALRRLVTASCWNKEQRGYLMNSCWRVMYSDRALRRLVTASCWNKEQRGYLMNSCWRVMYSDRALRRLVTASCWNKEH